MHMNGDRLSRRALLRAAGAGAVGTLAGTALGEAPAPAGHKVKGRIKQSLCRWCYSRVPLEKLAGEAARIGFKSIELIGPDEFKVVKRFGLTCAMFRCATGIENGLNRKENHARIEQALRQDIDFAAAEGLPNVLCMSGNRRGLPDDEGLANCALGLKRVLGYAEQKKVTVCMEGLNSKVDHKDYMYDRTRWGVDLCRKVGSPR